MKISASRRCALAMALLLSACGREKATQEADTGTPESGGVAVVAEGADINTPLIIVANSVLDGDLSADVMNMVDLT